MIQDDFFVKPSSTDDFLGLATSSAKLRTDLLSELLAGSIVGTADIDAAIALTDLVWNDFVAYGTGGGNTLNDKEIALAQRALTTTLDRIGISLKLPWRDFTTFRAYWVKNDGKGSWQARRDLLEKHFRPVQEELDRQEEAQFHAITAEAVTPHAATGWPKVDEELTELRRRFRTATTTQDYRDVGNRAVAVLEALSRTIYDPSRHVRDGETEPPVDKTKQRLGRYVEDSLAGKSNEAIRAVANKVIELAHAVKHSAGPSRREAGIAADSVIMLANILRRVDQDF